MMFRLTVWSRSYDLVGTIERESAVTLLDMGKRLQEDYGAVYKVEFIPGADLCPACGKAERSDGLPCISCC